MTRTPLPPDPYAQPVGNKSGVKTWQVLTAIGIGTFVGVVVVCGGGVALMAVYFQQQMTSFNSMMAGNFSVPNLSYTMQAPPTAVAGQPFEIELTLENTGSTPIKINSLDDYSGLTLIQSDPPWQSESGGVMDYQLTIPPNQTQTVKLTAQTDATGIQTLNIDAQTDMAFTEAYGSIDVSPAAPASP